jgi:hypothetical protein
VRPIALDPTERLGRRESLVPTNPKPSETLKNRASEETQRKTWKNPNSQYIWHVFDPFGTCYKFFRDLGFRV